MQKILQEELNKAAFAVKRGLIVAVPTETVYGLAVKLDRSDAIMRLLDVKERAVADNDKILTMMVPDIATASNYAVFNTLAERVAEQNFPGELTLVLPKNPNFRHAYFNNFSTVGIRVPRHDFMLELLKLTGPMLVTSANPRSEPACLMSDEVLERMPEIDAVVVGKAGGEPPSTVAAVFDDDIKILRQGNLEL